ncbi:hypothetical protein CYMTET_24344 [Cymbomonas tetramitiformis]|uniref:EF-hand domain-containing protein n=1 Tax=Cymbomonas tetramitiformis TaxID=36881 RepID=A0AAE0L054_9CHLO|nr:hypothetical protein CYMTET_24344 [Cymbomonas tetramitiformis]
MFGQPDGGPRMVTLDDYRDQKAMPYDVAKSVYGWLEKHGVLVRKKLSPKIITELHDYFQLIDSDGSGDVDYEELSEAMEIIGLSLSTHVSNAFLQAIDIDGSGSLEFLEFVEVMRGAIACEPAVNENGEKQTPGVLGDIRMDFVRLMRTQYFRRLLLQEVFNGKPIDAKQENMVLRNVERMKNEELNEEQPESSASDIKRTPERKLRKSKKLLRQRAAQAARKLLSEETLADLMCSRNVKTPTQLFRSHTRSAVGDNESILPEISFKTAPENLKPIVVPVSSILSDTHVHYNLQNAPEGSVARTAHSRHRRREARLSDQLKKSENLPLPPLHLEGGPPKQGAALAVGSSESDSDRERPRWLGSMGNRGGAEGAPQTAGRDGRRGQRGAGSQVEEARGRARLEGISDIQSRPLSLEDILSHRRPSEPRAGRRFQGSRLSRDSLDVEGHGGGMDSGRSLVVDRSGNGDVVKGVERHEHFRVVEKDKDKRLLIDGASCSPGRSHSSAMQLCTHQVHLQPWWPTHRSAPAASAVHTPSGHTTEAQPLQPDGEAPNNGCAAEVQPSQPSGVGLIGYTAEAQSPQPVEAPSDCMDQTQPPQPSKEHRGGCTADEAQNLPQRHAADLPPQQLSTELPQQQLITDAATTALLPQHLLSVAVAYASTAHAHDSCCLISSTCITRLMFQQLSRLQVLMGQSVAARGRHPLW